MKRIAAGRISASGAATALLLAITMVTAGCYYSTRMTQTPASSALPSGGAASPAPLVIESVTASLNGVPTSANLSFERDLVAGLRTLGYFSPIYTTDRADEAPSESARMRVEAAVVVDPHQGTALLKGFFIGLSLYLLTPVLPLTHDISQSVTATLTTSGGTIRRYEATASGRGTYALGANSTLMESELNSKVGTASLQGLLARIREDSVFRVAQ